MVKDRRKVISSWRAEGLCLSLKLDQQLIANFRPKGHFMTCVHNVSMFTPKQGVARPKVLVGLLLAVGQGVL